MSLKTQRMTVLPDEEIMKTDQPVEMKLGAMLVRGTGMVANNATQQVELESQSHIEFPPRGKR
jgi:lipopolysaccharide export system protein LptC